MKKLGIILFFILFAIPLPFAALYSLFALAGIVMELAELNFGMVVVYLMLMLAAVPYGLIYMYALLRTWDREKISLVTFTPVMQIAVAALLLVLINPVANLIDASEKYFGLRVGDYEIVESLDTHGGFHGDGTYYLILDCSKNREKALKAVSKWDRLPLPENVKLMMYGGMKNGRYYGYHLAEEANMPRIENGYYVFRDRYRGGNDPSDDSELLSRYSFNFTIAVYDADTDRMYYFEYDT
ncbi:MAG: hypothetical protein IJB75_07395 [Oscillospiraceae bacterium]|nr:hypothetical protein [Oscillospiraceae bacterium]